MLKKRGSVSFAKKEDTAAPAITAEAKEDETKRASISSKLRMSLSFRTKSKELGSSTSSALLLSTKDDQPTGYSKSTHDEPHPYENIDSLPDRRRAPSRKSVTWKDPETKDLNELLRTRSKSVVDRDGRRVSLTWTQSPMSGS
jgi:hypothetical protein